MRRTGEPEESGESGESGENDLLSFKAARLVQIQVLVVLRRRSKHGVEVINPSLVEASRWRAVIHTVQYRAFIIVPTMNLVVLAEPPGAKSSAKIDAKTHANAPSLPSTHE
jgi:hypothetical protein